MPEEIDRIIELVKAHLSGELSDAGRQELESWMNEQPVNRLLVEEFLDEEKLKAGIAETYWAKERIWEQLRNRLLFPAVESDEISIKRPVLLFKRQWWAIAASVIVVLGLGIYFYTAVNKKNVPPVIAKATADDISAPATNRAMITLADGSRVFLDSVNNGQLAKVGNIKLVKLASGQIAYQTADGQILKELQHNTLTNPRGSKVIHIALSDGSRVWLNAGSSITYPVAFVGDERKVELKGEGYFEVAKDPTKKFVVTANGTTTEVLGTHFNVNAYDGESETKITLLEGSVKVSNSSQQAVTIRPGQQAKVAGSQQPAIGNNIDIDQVMAWKNNLFKFNSTNIQEMMRQAERWYDIEVSYPSGVPDEQFGGTLSRDVSLSEFVKMLEYSDIKVKVSGRKVEVIK
ncbi:MAG: FecR domain-containing protein [Niabella sp.]